MIETLNPVTCSCGKECFTHCNNDETTQCECKQSLVVINNDEIPQITSVYEQDSTVISNVPNKQAVALLLIGAATALILSELRG